MAVRPRNPGTGQSRGPLGARPRYRFRRGHPVIKVKAVIGERTERRLARQDLLPDQSELTQRRDPSQYPSVAEVGKTFSNILTFDEWTFDRHTPFRNPQQADPPEDQLLPNGRNQSLVVNKIERSGETRVSALLKHICPRFERLLVRGRGGTAQIFFERGFKSSIPATRLSDGTLRFVALLAALLSPSPPTLLCKEKSELGLHPDAVALLVEASRRMQTVMTTHSDALVSALTDQPDNIVACERPRASTVPRRLDPEKLPD